MRVRHLAAALGAAILAGIAPGTALAGDEVIATGETRYTDGEVFSNLWQLTFAPDGRCSRFVEWYVLHR